MEADVGVFPLIIFFYFDNRLKIFKISKVDRVCRTVKDLLNDLVNEIFH